MRRLHSRARVIALASEEAFGIEVPRRGIHSTVIWTRPTATCITLLHSSLNSHPPGYEADGLTVIVKTAPAHLHDVSRWASS